MKAIGKSDGVHGPQKTLNLFIRLNKIPYMENNTFGVQM